MWQEERFLFSIVPEVAHYLSFLFVGILLFYLLKRAPNTLRSVELLGLTLILYICRPWEVLPPTEGWLALPRWCILTWVFFWLMEIESKKLFWKGCLSVSSGMRLYFLMGAWCFITTFFSGDSTFSQQYFIDTLLRGLILAALMHLSVQSEQSVFRLEWAFVVGVTTLILHSLWHYNGGDMPEELSLIRTVDSKMELRLTAVGSLGNSNDVAAVALIAAGFLWPQIFSKKTSIYFRALSLIIFAFLTQAVLAAQSRGALMALTAQMILFFVSQSKRSMKWCLLPAFGVLLTGAFANSWMGRHSDDLDASTESRMNYYLTGLRMAARSPIWGQGFGRYPYEFERHTTQMTHEWGLRTAHSNWILVLAETGFVGLILFSFIHLRIWKICWMLRRERPSLLCSFTGYSLATVFLSHAWLMFPWVLFTIVELSGKYKNDGRCSLLEGSYANANDEKASLDCSTDSMAGALRREPRQCRTH